MIIGRIAGSHGIKGYVKIEAYTDFVSRFAKGSRVRIGEDWHEIESSTMHKGRPLIKLSGINDKTTADSYQWRELTAADTEPELDEDEFLIEDLLGLRARTIDGVDLGVVDEILENPAHEILVIGEILVPFVEEFVREIDFDAETITLSLLPGMIPGEEAA